MKLDDDLARVGHDAYEAKAREMGHVSGSPVPWEDVPEPYRSCTVAAYEALLAAFLPEGTEREMCTTHPERGAMAFAAYCRECWDAERRRDGEAAA